MGAAVYHKVSASVPSPSNTWGLHSITRRVHQCHFPLTHGGCLLSQDELSIVEYPLYCCLQYHSCLLLNTHCILPAVLQLCLLLSTHCLPACSTTTISIVEYPLHPSCSTTTMSIVEYPLPSCLQYYSYVYC